MKPIVFTNLMPGPGQTFVTTRKATLETALETCGFQDKQVIQMAQTHSKNIREISQHNFPKARQKILDTDAVFTTITGLVLIVQTADCLPILVWHPSGLIGAIHAGRVGTEAGITKAFFREVKDKKGLNTNFEIYFGPHILAKDYEVNPDTHETFDIRQHNIDQINSQLIDYKLFESPYNTIDNNELFHSFRKERTAHRIYSGISY